MSIAEEQMALALKAIASALRDLGTANAATPMGALEMVAMELKEGSTRIAEGLFAIADAIREHGDASTE